MVIYSLNNLDEQSLNEVGKTAKTYNNLSKLVKINEGFVISGGVFNYFIKEANIKNKIINLLNIITNEDKDKTNHISNEIQKLILNQKLPNEINEAINEAYNSFSIDENLPLNKMISSNKKFSVDLISSTTDYDFKEIRITNINNIDDLINAILSIYAYYFSIDNILKIKDNKFLNVAIIIKKRTNKEISGSFYIKNKNNYDYLVISCVYGLNFESTNNFSDVYLLNYNNLEIFELNKQKQNFYFSFNEETTETIKKEIDTENQNLKILEDKIIEYSKKFKEILNNVNKKLVYNFFIKNDELYIDNFEEITEKNTILFEEIIDNISNSTEELNIENDDVNNENFDENKNIFSLYKSQSNETKSLNYENDENNLINDNFFYTANYSLGLCVLNCYLSIFYKLKEKNLEIFNSNNIYFNSLIENLSRELNIPHVEEIQKIEKIKNNFLKENKMPTIIEVDFVLNYTQKFLEKFI